MSKMTSSETIAKVRNTVYNNVQEVKFQNVKKNCCSNGVYDQRSCHELWFITIKPDNSACVMPSLTHH